jgi:hypothetical protein
MDRDLIERLWQKADGDQLRFASSIAEACAVLAEQDPGDGTWLGEATRRAAARRIRQAFDSSVADR